MQVITSISRFEETMDNSESINNPLQHLCVFYSEPKSFKQIAFECQFLESFTVIGQNVENLEGIQKLRNLEELWLVDCNLKQEVRDFVYVLFVPSTTGVFKNQVTCHWLHLFQI